VDFLLPEWFPEFQCHIHFGIDIPTRRFNHLESGRKQESTHPGLARVTTALYVDLDFFHAPPQGTQTTYIQSLLLQF
jgi:hypothetical protein